MIMPYEVTATRKRPRVFEELSGQQFVASTLMSSLSQNRIAHAYLFSGPRGVGKTSAARILAKALNCEDGPKASPCGTCSSCKEIASANALDVIEIDGASNTSVNDVREIKNEVLFAPNSSRYKVYIIDEVHMLSNSAFNALLKTIEEPPPYIVFIFATTEGHKVPATIRSRCQQFHFQLISLEIIKERIFEAAGEQKLTIDEEALFWIAKEATGSLRDAYTLFDQIASFSEGEITMERIKEKLGLIGSDTVSSLADLFSRGEAAEAIDLVQEVLSHGVAVEQFIVELAEYFRSMLFMKQGVTRESLLGTQSGSLHKDTIDRFSQEQLETTLDMLLDLYRSIRYSVNQRYELELVVSRLTQITKRMTAQQVYERIEQLRTGMRDGLEADSEPPPSEGTGIRRQVHPAPAEKREPVREKPLTDADISHMMKALKHDRPTLAALLETAERSLAEGELQFKFSSSYGSARAKQELKNITKLLSDIAGRAIPVQITEIVSEPPSPDQPAEGDDTVQMVQHLFRGEIISGGSHESE